MTQNQPSSRSLRQSRLSHLRKLMQTQKIDVLLIRSTDQYLNEYVPADQSRRTYITGFTGSVGDVLVTASEQILFVDGRYTLQAKQECPDWDVRVASLGFSIEESWLNELAKLKNQGDKTFAVETDRISITLFEKVQDCAQQYGLRIVVPIPALVELTRNELGPNPSSPSSKIWSVPVKITGNTAKQRLKIAEDFLGTKNLDGLCMVLLDEIAWLTNIRGDQFPYQATFSSKAIAFADKVWVLLSDAHHMMLEPEPGVRFIAPEQWTATLKERFSSKTHQIGIDPDRTPEAIHQELKAAGAHIIFTKSPFGPMKAKKTAKELAHMRSAFARADQVVYKTQSWALKQISLGKNISESDVDAKVRQEFLKSGAWGLSFKPICAAGKNGAFIHYGTPNPDVLLKKGDLFLLDTGGLYEGGYATDLTRTFLIGDKKTIASPFQKQLFTTVLKGAIAGMSARFPKGTTGVQLDAIVRNPIWKTGMTYNHGTGHGVGINVHEFPPSIRPDGRIPLEVGHVFSIEPGLYIEGFGGVRIENLCTVVEDPENPQFLCVLPLTFAPLDARLFDKMLLSVEEKTFLKYYTNCFRLPAEEFPSLPAHLSLLKTHFK